LMRAVVAKADAIPAKRSPAQPGEDEGLVADPPRRGRRGPAPPD
jgi:hypothetical protein